MDQISTLTREKLRLPKQLARELACGDDSDDFKVIEKQLIGHGRWSLHYKIVVRRLSDGKFFMSEFSCGATESQDEPPYEYQEPDFIEVFPATKTVTVYE